MEHIASGYFYINEVRNDDFIYMLDPTYTTASAEYDLNSGLGYPNAGRGDLTRIADNDDDGLSASEDCNDSDPTVGGPVSYFRDADGDGFGDAKSTEEACEASSGFVADATDCNDSDAEVNPDASERCNDTDDDCNGTVDDNALDASLWYIDADGDGYGTDKETVTECDAPDGTAAVAGDCDDSTSQTYPGATETPYDGVDQDCDGTDLTDVDGDGFDATEAGGLDCDDADPAVNPDAEDLKGDGIDQDCDGADAEEEEPPAVGSEEEITGGCSCSSTSSTPLSLWWGATFIGLALLRRRSGTT